MTSQISAWITIVVFAVSRTQSVLGEGSDSICYKGLSRQEIRTSSYRAIDNTRLWFPDFGRTFLSPEFHTTYEHKNYTRFRLNCCSGYEGNTKNCACSAWRGDSCDEPLVCFMVQPNPDQNSLAIEQVLVWNDTKDATNKPLNLSKGVPKQCLPECLNQMKSSNINANQLGNGNYYLIPIDTPCNIVVVDWIYRKRNASVIGTVIGITLLAIAILVGFIIQRKRSKSNTVHGDTTELTENNDVGMEPTRVYDYVDVEPNCNYDDANIARTCMYDNVHMWPNRNYDNVYMGSFRNYDDVTIAPVSKYDDVSTAPAGNYDDVTTEPVDNYDDVTMGPVRNYDDVAIEPVQNYEDMAIEPVRNYDDVAIEPVQNYNDVAIEPVRNYDDVAIEPPVHNYVNVTVGPVHSLYQSNQRIVNVATASQVKRR